MSDPTLRFSITINNGCSYIAKDWEQAMHWMQSQVVYDMEDLKVGEAMRVEIVRCEMSDEEMANLPEWEG